MTYEKYNIVTNVSGFQYSQISMISGSLITGVLGNAHIDVNQQETKPEELIKSLGQDFFQRLSKDSMLRQDLDEYVLPDGASSENDSARRPFYSSLLEKEGFLTSDENLLLLVGDSGSGKSLGLRHLASIIWLAREKPKELSDKGGFTFEMIQQLKEYVPLIVALKSLEKSPKEFIPWILQNYYHYTSEQIQILKKDCKFLLLLDGYDELTGPLKTSENFYEGADLSKWKAKVIVSCRSQHLTQMGDYKTIFSNISYGHNYRASFRELWLAPFNDKQIDEYLDRPNVTFEEAKIKGIFKKFPSLKSIVTSPSLLKMVVGALSKIEKQLEKNKTQLTRASVYKTFIQTWFEREFYRLQEINKGREFKGLIPESFQAFAQDLAFQMFIKDSKQITTDESVQENPSSWDEFLGSDDEIIVQKRMACPLTYRNGHYSFYHKSLLEYFTASYLYNYSLNLAGEESNFQQVLGTLKENALNQKLITSEPAIIEFLAEMLDDNSKAVKGEEKTQRLFEIINASKGKPELGIAGANAITVLNYARVSFTGKNFSAVNIPGADLSYAMLDNTCFHRANLQGVNLSRAFLRETDLTQADLTDARFGEFPSLMFSSGANTFTYSPNGSWLAVAVGYSIELWYGNESKKVATLEGHTDAVTSMSFDSSGSRIVSGSADKMVRLWALRNLKSFESLVTFKGHTDAVTSVLFDPSGKRIVSGSKDKSVMLWQSPEMDETKWQVIWRSGTSSSLFGIGAFFGGTRLSPQNEALLLQRGALNAGLPSSTTSAPPTTTAAPGPAPASMMTTTYKDTSAIAEPDSSANVKSTLYSSPISQPISEQESNLEIDKNKLELGNSTVSRRMADQYQRVRGLILKLGLDKDEDKGETEGEARTKALLYYELYELHTMIFPKVSSEKEVSTVPLTKDFVLKF